MTNPIDSLIQERRAEIDRYRRKIELLEAELRGIELARTAIPGAEQGRPPAPRPVTEPNMRDVVPSSAVSRGPRRGGRQPGSITQASRQKLHALYATYGSDGFSQEDYEGWLRERGDRCKPSDVERRLNAFTAHGYIERTDSGRYRVTEFAVRKYGFQAPMPSARYSEPPSEDHNEAEGAGAPVKAETPQEDQVPSGTEPEGLGADEGTESGTSPSHQLAAIHTPAEPG